LESGLRAYVPEKDEEPKDPKGCEEGRGPAISIPGIRGLRVEET